MLEIQSGGPGGFEVRLNGGFACELVVVFTCEPMAVFVRILNKTGNRSIAVSGGSLRRKVDVVPSCWHDTASYQLSGAKHDREVKVFDKSLDTLISNRPFLYMKQVIDKDIRTLGGAKKAIRLLKNLKRDSNGHIELTSYDIASLIWHMNDQALAKPYFMELSLVAELSEFLSFIISNPVKAFGLMTPDSSRAIFDTADKFLSLTPLKREVDELAREIAQELNPLYTQTEQMVAKSLREATVY